MPLIGGRVLLPMVMLVGLTSFVSGEPPKAETVLTGLTNPWGVAVQPETGAVFVANSGAGTIVRLAGENKADEVISGAPLQAWGEYKVGPLAVGFFDKATLVVGDGGLKPGFSLLRIFKLSDDAKKLDYTTATNQNLGPLAATGPSQPPGNFSSLVVTKGAVFATCTGETASGGVARCAIEGTKFGTLETYIAAKRGDAAAVSTAVAVSPRGEIVVGMAGKKDASPDSEIAFFGATNVRQLMTLKSDLRDISALAYDPKTGLLYALDAAWTDPTHGGLYRLDRAATDGAAPLKATKLLELVRPTAMAFAADGTLYVTTLGSGAAGENSGALVKIELK